MRFILAPFALTFSFFSWLRAALYHAGILKTLRLDKPVISVGNLTAGGTGKTPFVDILLKQLEGQNLKAGVLTRGYGRKSDEVCLVSPDSTSSQVGDEPLWLYRRHPQIPIAVGADRIKASRLIQNVDVYILDDGFQHLAVDRDLDVVLIDATAPSWNYHLLPWGLAREGWGALRRADLVVINRANQVSEEKADSLADGVFKRGVMEVVEGSQDFESCRDLFTGEILNLSGHRVGLVSGIGNAESFEWVVHQAKMDTVFHEEFTDHVIYDVSTVRSFIEKAAKEKAEALLITEKDAVKWKEVLKHPPNIPVGVVSVRMTFNPDLPAIYDLASHNFR